jgi:hypothetical protein
VTLKPSARLQNESRGRTRQGKKDQTADCHESQRDPIICWRVDADDIGHGEADLAAGQIGKNHDKILQDEDRHDGRQAEIGAFHAQGGQRQNKAADDRGEGPERDAYPDRIAISVIDYAGGIGAEAEQKGGAEIHLVREAEQQIPGH